MMLLVILAERCPNSTVRKFRSIRLKSDPFTSWDSRLICSIISSRSISVAVSIFSAMAFFEKPSSYIASILSPTYCISRNAITVFSGKKSSTGIFFSLHMVSSGTMFICSRRSLDNWVSTSKVRIESMSSPKKSIRKGYSHEKEKTSIMLPRLANCPGS